jgi:hypothetical protein
MLKSSEAATANDIYESSELLKIAARPGGEKNRLAPSPGNAISLNSVVRRANREIGVPGGLMIVVILVFMAPVPIVFLLVLVQFVVIAIGFVALVPIVPIRAILIAVPGMVVAMIFIVDAHATGTTRTRNGNQETCG